jgi:hypothetical protein
VFSGVYTGFFNNFIEVKMSDDKRPREFWIQDLAETTYRATDVSCYDEEVNPSIIDEWHVIEHSAYAALQKENEELKADIEKLKNYEENSGHIILENLSLRTSLKEAVEALDFYSIDYCYDEGALIHQVIAKIKAKHGEI